MEKSESIGEITKALAAFRSELPEIKLNSTVKVALKTGGSYSFRYADLPHIKSIAEPVLSKNGLFVSQFLEGNSDLTTLVSHTSGEYFQSTTKVGVLEGKTAQEYGSLITYFKRYSYCAVLGIAADDDDDANTGSGNGVEKKPVIQAPENAPWLSEIQYNKAIADINNGEKGVFDKLCAEFKIKKIYRQGLEAAEKNPVGKMPGKEKTPDKEPEKVKPEILPNTEGWYKTVTWLADQDGFFLDAIDKLKVNYIISKENIEQLEKEAQIIIKGKVKEPTTDEKAKQMVKA